MNGLICAMPHRNTAMRPTPTGGLKVGSTPGHDPLSRFVLSLAPNSYPHLCVHTHARNTP